jgi:predicted membrane-bound spermidine synthase
MVLTGGGKHMGRIPLVIYLGMSRLAVLVGVLCIIIAFVTALIDRTVFALTSTYVQIAIASFLVAIWFAVMALLDELRDQGSKSR